MEIRLRYEMNAMWRRAHELLEADRAGDAMAIYLAMADGDRSLDAGNLAKRIGWCCEVLGDPHAAKWWYGRAVEENPSIGIYVEARKRMEWVCIESLMTS